jgi:hypothetical protein
LRERQHGVRLGRLIEDVHRFTISRRP